MWPIVLCFIVRGVVYALQDMHHQAIEDEYLPDDRY